MGQTFKILQLFWCEKTKSVYIVAFFGHLFIAWQTFSKLKNFPVKYLQVFFINKHQSSQELWTWGQARCVHSTDVRSSSRCFDGREITKKGSLPSNANVTCCFLLMSRKVQLIVYFKSRCHAEPHCQERHTKQMLGELHGPLQWPTTVIKFIDTKDKHAGLPHAARKASAYLGICSPSILNSAIGIKHNSFSLTPSFGVFRVHQCKISHLTL